MKAATSHQTLEVDALRVGIFVQLDGGWMSHPFPVSNFRIVSAEQIETIRSLGITRVRWSPEQSDPVLPEPTNLPAGHTAPPPEASGDEPMPSARAAADASEARRSHRHQLLAEAAALQLCERQFAEAARDCRRLTDLAVKRPQEAREQAEALTRALAEKMLVKEELCIRLLADGAGDKAAAHSLNVTIISMLMGRSFGLTEADLLDLGTGAMLHDIGKLELPDRVRHHDEQFSSAETRFYEEHVAHGVALANRMGLSPGATLVIAQHHEQSDGGGFPMRLGSDRMTAAARIVALVNRFDKLCNPYQPGKAMTPHEALALLFAQGKTMFDTAILGAFIKMMGVYPAGSTVQLTDDRFAMVVGVNSSRPLRPRVLVHEAKVAREDALILDLGDIPRLGIRRSIRPQQLPGSVRDYLSPRRRIAYFFEPMAEASLAA